MAAAGAAAEVPKPAVFAQGGGASRPGAGWVIASSLLLQNAEVSAEWLGLVVIIVIIVVIIVIVFLANGHHRYLLGSGSGSGRCRWSHLLLITCDQAQRHAISICCHICHSRYMMISRPLLVVVTAAPSLETPLRRENVPAGDGEAGGQGAGDAVKHLGIGAGLLSQPTAAVE